VFAINQAEAYGIPIAQVLRVQARELRVLRRQRAEERAMKIPVKIVLPSSSADSQPFSSCSWFPPPSASSKP